MSSLESAATRSALHEDDALLRRFLAGDPRACRQIERWAWEIVRSPHYRLLSSEREDLIQEALGGVLQAASKQGFKLRVGLRPFVHTVAAARCIDRLRRLRPSVELPDAIPDPRPSPYDAVLAADDRARLRWALRAVSPACREIIRFRYVENLTYPEIAARLQRAESTLRVRMFQCIRTLRALFDRWSARP